MPALPDELSSTRRRPASSPALRAASSMRATGRSLIEPPGLTDSSLANTRAPRPTSNSSSSNSGVCPMPWSTWRSSRALIARSWLVVDTGFLSSSIGIGRSSRSAGHRAEDLVVDVAREARPRRAVAAGGIRRERELGEALAQGVVVEQAPDQRLAEAEQELHRLDRLERPDHAGQRAEHAGVGAGGRELGRRGRGIEAAVARPAARGRLRPEDRDLALEAVDRAVHVGEAELHAGVVDEVARGEVVGAVDHDLVAAQDILDVAGVEARLVPDELDVRVEGGERPERRLHLGRAGAL